MRFCEGENAEVVQKKLVKACRNLSLSESMRSFPVCSLQLTASSRSSTPCLPPSPSQSHLSSVSLPPLNLSDAVGPDLTLLPLWWFFLSFPVLLTMFTYSTFFHVLVSPLSAVYKWQQGNALIWPFLAAAPLGPHSSNPLYFVILIWAQIIITCNICTISIHITLSTGSRLIYRLAWTARLLAESGTPCSFHFLISHLFIHPLTVLCRCTAHTNGEEVSCKIQFCEKKESSKPVGFRVFACGSFEQNIYAHRCQSAYSSLRHVTMICSTSIHFTSLHLSLSSQQTVRKKPRVCP